MGRGAGGLCDIAGGLLGRCGGAAGAYAGAARPLQGAAGVCVCERSSAYRAGQGAAFQAEGNGRRASLNIAVLGGGNGSFAAAGDFALQGHDVSLWRRDAAAVAMHCTAGTRITVKDVNGRQDVQIALVTTNIEAAVAGAKLILCPAPAFAQADIAKQLAPHLRDGQVVFLPPA